MTPQEIRSKVQTAHRKALENRSMQMLQESGAHRLLCGVKLFGQEAGIDFVETNLTSIVQEAVSMAECKKASLELPAYDCGRAAIGGMAKALHDLTSLPVQVSGNTIRVIWAEADLT